MIYNIKTRTMIVTPPKCGTTILHHAMCSFPNYWYVLGPTKWDSTSKHCSSYNIKTNEIIINRWVLLIRNPIDRMVSMWKHRQSYDKYEGNLIDFVVNYNLSEGWYAPCVNYCNKIDAVIHQENMLEDCKKIFGFEFGELKTKRMNDAKFSHVLTDQEIEVLKNAACTIYHNDLRVGSYEI